MGLEGRLHDTEEKAFLHIQGWYWCTIYWSKCDTDIGVLSGGIKANATNYMSALLDWSRTWDCVGYGSRGKLNSIVLLKQHSNKQLFMVFCYTHKPVLCLATIWEAPSSSQLEWTQRIHNWTVCTMWEVSEFSILNSMFLSNLPLYTQRPVQKRRQKDCKRVYDTKETMFPDTSGGMHK